MSGDEDVDDDPSADDELSVDSESIAPDNSSTGRQSVPCPRCDTPGALVVSYGPTAREASPCGCRVSGSILEGNVADLE